MNENTAQLHCFADKLQYAWIWRTRSEAREECFKHETVRKVSLTKEGGAKKIIGRG